MTQTIWILVSILAGILLSTVSNWLFELLKVRLFPDRPNRKEIIRVGVFTFTVIIVLIVSQALAQNTPPDEKNNSAQATFAALEIEQLAIQRQIATAQSDIATAQAGHVDGLSATAIAKRLFELSGTQAALGIEATRVAPSNTETTPISTRNTSQIGDPKDGMVLLFVSAGNFLMGSAINYDAPAGEKPQHLVYLNDFSIDQTEVTIDQYARFVSETGYQTSAEINSYGYIWVDDRWQTQPYASWQDPDGDGLANNVNLPVTQVSWEDAGAYCAWAGRRLPTEAEWEKAARGLDGRSYPWGNAFPDDSLARFNQASGASKVGSYPNGASPYGVLDMAGNVWEWTADWYSPDYYASSPSNDPKGPSSGDHRVLRGGGWNTSPKNIRVTHRDVSEPWYTNNMLGFRCAK